MTDKQRLKHSLVFPIFFLVLIWCMKLLELAFGYSFAFLGVYPQTIHGLIGIVTSPLVHGDFKHLLNNSVPLLILSVGVFYFYRPLGYKVFFLSWLITGIWVWCGARDAYHIGASGIVYSLASFLFFSGVFRRIPGLAAISLIVTFLYGSMIWGIFPFIPDVSWESHLSGGIAGLLLAIFYRKNGPQLQKYEWELNDEDSDDYPVSDDDKVLLELNQDKETINKPENVENKTDATEMGKIVYFYKKGDEKKEE
jgi:membrane associated rhomboid family serine protease